MRPENRFARFLRVVGLFVLAVLAESLAPGSATPVEDPPPPDSPRVVVAGCQELPPDTLRMTLFVELSPAEAFAKYSEDIDGWWPVETHSLGKERIETVVFESGVGGEIYAVWDDGSLEMWGKVLAWDPPGHLAYSWYPGRSPDTALDVDVRFEPAGSGTELRIEQTAWERLGDRSEEVRAAYVRGWPVVLDAYEEATR